MFEIDISPDAMDHIKALRKRDQQMVLDAIKLRLRHEPHKPARNRKRLDDNPLVPWELRVGSF